MTAGISVSGHEGLFRLSQSSEFEGMRGTIKLRVVRTDGLVLYLSET